jgi:hypothetical protein
MPVSADFAYRTARLLLLDDPEPWSAWKVVPLTVPATSIEPDAEYDEAWEAFDRKDLADWSIQPYVAPGVPPPPNEVLPYVYQATLPAPWLNDTAEPITVVTIAVVAWNGSEVPAPRWELLFWEGLEPTVTVQPSETFAVTELKFEIVELADG